MSTSTKITNEGHVFGALNFIADIGTQSNTYVAIGRGYPWANGDTIVPVIVDSVDVQNQMYRDLVALKQIITPAAALVVPRVDWSNGTTYAAFSDDVDFYSYYSLRQGNGTCTFSNTTVIGNNSTFLLDFANNSIFQVPGDGVTIQPTNFEVINVVSNTQMQVNVSPAQTFTNNTVFNVSNTYPNYASNFYVRNTYDQVFVCLGNNNSIPSNTMPQISLGGQLPNSQFIITADGYNWKYMYTIPSGYKQNFLTQSWMPVIVEAQVQNSAVAGRLDIIQILNAGRGYNNTVACTSAAILTVTGDGINGSLTAITDANGSITGINIINAGSGYTNANVTVATGANGVNAVIVPVIGPQGGWGSNAYLELGAHTVMFSVFLNQTESGTIPVQDAFGGFFTYRQIAVVSNPTLNSNGAFANASNYDLTTQISVASNTPFQMGTIAYQSPTGKYANATFTGNVVWFDASTLVLHLNNMTGTFSPQSQIYATTNVSVPPYASVSVFNAAAPLITPFSGTILYMENRTGVQRALNQNEDIKVILTF